MSDTKICPFCGEEIKVSAIKCRHCGKMISNKSRKNLITTITIILLILCILFGLFVFISDFQRINKARTIYVQDFKKSISFIKQAILLNEALGEAEPQTMKEFIKMLHNRLAINPESSSANKVVMQNGTEFRFVDLNRNCTNMPSKSNINESTACAKIIIDVNNSNKPNRLGIDRFSVLVYSDDISVIPGSREEYYLNKIQQEAENE